ncbi:MAG: glycosyltransferase family 1 protein [Candidatus Gracilibacteria bacterium]
MKIGIDASRYGHSEATGVENYSFQIINYLIGEVAGNSKDKVVLYSREAIFPKMRVAKNITNMVLPTKRFWTLWALSREMRRDKPDVLFVPSHVFPLSLAKKNYLMIHDVAFRHLRSAYSFFQYHYLNWSTRVAAKKATKIIVPSEATAKDLVHFYKCPKKKIVVIPHGFAKPRLDKAHLDNLFEFSEIFKYFGIDEKLKYVFFVGRLESKKNLVRLVEAFAEFAEDHEDFKLVMAGKPGVGFDKILKKIQQLKIANKVVLPGYVTEGEKAALMKNCQIFAFPSLYEGFGLPLLEAFYYEKPVLCSSSSSLPEVGGKAVHYVDPLNVSEMAEGLKKLAEDEKYAAKLVAKGRERLPNFTWEASAKRTLKVLHG